jgi:hypothetical protein
MAFNTEISYYAGSITNKDTHIAKFLVNGVQWVISMIEKTNPDMLPLFATLQTLNDSSRTLALNTNSKIIDIVRRNGNATDGEELKCSPINAAFRSNAKNTDSIYYASKNSPVYYIDNAVLNVLPVPDNDEIVKISMVLPDASVAHTESSISNFPSEMYHAVILYAAIQLLHHKMTDLNSKLPTDLDADTTVFNALSDYSGEIVMSSSLPTAINMGSTGLPSAITVDAPLPGGIAIGTSLPTAIDVSSVTFPTVFTPTTSIPTIAIPEIPSDFQDAMDKAKNLIDGTEGGTGDSSTAQSWLADEDEEMTQATVGVASQEIQRATSALSKWREDISKAGAIFQSDMQKHQADVTKETQRIANEVSRYTTLLGKESARTQTELANYSAEIGKEGQRIQADTSTYTTELGLKSAQMQQEVSEYTNLLGKETSRIQQESGNYTAELQKESTRIQNDLAKYSANLQKKISLYTTIITKLTTDYQWLQGQYQVAKQELSEFMAPYTQAGVLDSTAEGVRR